MSYHSDRTNPVIDALEKGHEPGTRTRREGAQVGPFRPDNRYRTVTDELGKVAYLADSDHRNINDLLALATPETFQYMSDKAAGTGHPYFLFLEVSSTEQGLIDEYRLALAESPEKAAETEALIFRYLKTSEQHYGWAANEQEAGIIAQARLDIITLAADPAYDVEVHYVDILPPVMMDPANAELTKIFWEQAQLQSGCGSSTTPEEMARINAAFLSKYPEDTQQRFKQFMEDVFEQRMGDMNRHVADYARNIMAERGAESAYATFFYGVKHMDGRQDLNEYFPGRLVYPDIAPYTPAPIQDHAPSTSTSTSTATTTPNELPIISACQAQLNQHNIILEDAESGTKSPTQFERTEDASQRQH